VYIQENEVGLPGVDAVKCFHGIAAYGKELQVRVPADICCQQLL
jgi:hypothetical protein